MYFTKNEDGTYAEVTDKLYSEVEYKSVKEKNNELRNTNTTLLKTNESLSAFAEVLDGVQNITPEGLMKKIEEKASVKASSMVTEMKSKHELEVKVLSEQLQGTNGTLNKLLLGDAVRKAGPKHGVQETAYDDVIRRAEADFVVKEGKVAFKHDKLDSNGKPYEVETWLAETVKNAPHLAVAPKGPAAKQNPSFRAIPLNTEDRRSGTDLIASGLASKNTQSKGLN